MERDLGGSCLKHMGSWEQKAGKVLLSRCARNRTTKGMMKANYNDMKHEKGEKQRCRIRKDWSR